MIFDKKTVVVTGGTGSLGRAFVERVLGGTLGRPKKVIVFSRDEAKQHEMRMDYQHRAVSTDEVIFRNFMSVLEFRIGPAERLEIVSVIRKPRDVGLHVRASGGARLGRVVLEDHRLLDADPRLGPDLRAHFGGVLGRYEVGVGAVGLGRAQFEHLGMQRRQHYRNFFLRLGRHVERALHLGEIFLHEAVRLVVIVAAEIADQRLVADPDAEQEPSTRKLAERVRGRRHRDRVTRPDIRDSGGKIELAGLGEQVSGMGERLASDRFGDP